MIIIQTCLIIFIAVILITGAIKGGNSFGEVIRLGLQNGFYFISLIIVLIITLIVYNIISFHNF